MQDENCVFWLLQTPPLFWRITSQSYQSSEEKGGKGLTEKMEL